MKIKFLFCVILLLGLFGNSVVVADGLTCEEGRLLISTFGAISLNQMTIFLQDAWLHGTFATVASQNHVSHHNTQFLKCHAMNKIPFRTYFVHSCCWNMRQRIKRMCRKLPFLIRSTVILYNEYLCLKFYIFMSSLN